MTKEKGPEEFIYTESTPKKRRSHSLFGPIVLIAIGVFFLLVNLGIIQDYSFNWTAVLQLWPLFLILIGVNIIVKQAPPPVGSLLSALVGLTALAIFGYVLLFSDDNPMLGRLGVSNLPSNYQTEQIDYAPGDVESAAIDIDFGAVGGDVSALSGSNSLIAGQVSYVGDLIFETSTAAGHADVVLYEKGNGLFWLNPSNWSINSADTRWDLGLDPTVEMELRLDSGAGSVNFDLSELTLSYLQIDGSAGSATVALPDGVYDVKYDQGAGSLTMTLPENGRQTVELDGAAGSMTLYLPASMAARVEIDSGAGSFNPSPRFTQVSGSDNNEGVWETEDYADAPDRVDVIIDMGAGSVTIREP
jgi:hypothetical protein